MLATYTSGGSCVEDSKRISAQISDNSLGYKLCSPDIILKSFAELSTDLDFSRSESGIDYKFNHNPALTQLAIKGLVQCGQLDKKTRHVFDYDNLFIPAEKYDAKPASIPFTAFMEEKGYRLVVQRTLRENGQSDLFEGEYVYRRIHTNDIVLSNNDIVLFYNQRGTTERCFDCMNNDFGWSHLPCSFMEKNTVLMGIMIILHNFYRQFLTILEDKGFGLKKTSRVKAFVFRFASVPFKWVTVGTTRVLRLFTTNRAYLQLQV